MHAPALQRGIELIRRLQDGNPRTLEALARECALPKSSLLRLLTTLEQSFVVRRDPITKDYVAIASLMPIHGPENRRSIQVSDALTRLSSLWGHTAEWWVPGGDGLSISDRKEPENTEVRVIARIGYTRGWNGELDAIALLARGHIKPDGVKLSGNWEHAEGGQQRALNQRECLEKVEKVQRQGWAADVHYNPNGVRRIASAVVHEGELLGVIALAMSYSPRLSSSEDRMMKSLEEEKTRILSC